MDINSLSHTKWKCKYHIVFAPKYRRKVAYRKMKQDIANILSMLCKRKGVEIVKLFNLLVNFINHFKYFKISLLLFPSKKQQTQL